MTSKNYGLKVKFKNVYSRCAILTIFFCIFFKDGGRLEKELKYIRSTLGDGFGNTDQIIIQTPKYNDDSVLNSASLLFHLKVMRTAITTTVEMFDS